jgi:hypothetical protein
LYIIKYRLLTKLGSSARLRLAGNWIGDLFVTLWPYLLLRE